MRHRLLFVLVFLVTFPLTTFSASPTVSTVYTVPTDAVFNYYSTYLFWTRTQRLFTRDPLDKIRGTQGIINNLFTRAATAFASGDMPKTVSLMQQIDIERSALSLEIDEYKLSTPNEKHVDLEGVIADEAIRLSYLPTESDVADKSSSQLFERLQTDSLRAIDAEVNASNLSTEEKTAKLNRIVEDFGRKSLKTDENLAQKLVLVGQLKVINTETDLSVLDNQESNLMVRTTKLPVSQLVRLARYIKVQGELEPSLGVIQKLASSAPSVRTDLEAELKPLVNDIASRIENNTDAVTTLLRVVGSSEARNALIKKIEAAINSDDARNKMKARVADIEKTEIVNEVKKKEVDKAKSSSTTQKDNG